MTAFQEQLWKDIKKLHHDNKIFISADKSTNIYKMQKEKYEKLLFENIVKIYKSSRTKTLNYQQER